MKRPVAFLLVLFSTAHAIADELVFEMSVWGYTFGTMVVSRTIENDSTEVYTVKAMGETDFFWMKRKEESHHRVVYVNGELRSSEYTYLNRGEKEKWSNVSMQNGEYIVSTNEGERRLPGSPIDFSLVRMYFNPTFERTEVFCEEDCGYSTLIPIQEKNIIKVSCKDGAHSTYHIKDGQVAELEVHLPVATVKLKRVR